MFTIIFLSQACIPLTQIGKKVISVTFHYFALESRRIYVPHDLVVSGIKAVDSSG